MRETRKPGCGEGLPGPVVPPTPGSACGRTFAISCSVGHSTSWRLENRHPPSRLLSGFMGYRSPVRESAVSTRRKSSAHASPICWRSEPQSVQPCALVSHGALCRVGTCRSQAHRLGTFSGRTSTPQCPLRSDLYCHGWKTRWKSARTSSGFTAPCSSWTWHTHSTTHRSVRLSPRLQSPRHWWKVHGAGLQRPRVASCRGSSAATILVARSTWMTPFGRWRKPW